MPPPLLLPVLPPVLPELPLPVLPPILPLAPLPAPMSPLLPVPVEPALGVLLSGLDEVPLEPVLPLPMELEPALPYAEYSLLLSLPSASASSDLYCWDNA